MLFLKLIRHKTILIIGLFLTPFIIMVGLFSTYQNSILKIYASQTAQFLVHSQLSQNFDIASLDFETVIFKSLSTIEVKHIIATVIISSTNEIISGQDLQVSIKRLTLRLDKLLKKRFILTVDDLSISQSSKINLSEKKEDTFFEHLEKGRFSIKFRLDPLQIHNAAIQFKQYIKKMESLLNGEKVDMPIQFYGISSFTINDETVKAKIITECDKYSCGLIVNKEFFKLISWLMQEDLSDPEIKLLSRNPFRVPKLLNLRNIAQNESENKYKKNKTIPKDAYRHVLWSYLLTKEYGAVFSKEVTDAHEEGDTNNSEAEHNMDYNNNSIGRKYSLSNYNQNEILFKLLSDPQIIRYVNN